MCKELCLGQNEKETSALSDLRLVERATFSSVSCSLWHRRFSSCSVAEESYVNKPFKLNRQTDRQTDKQTDEQTNKGTKEQTNKRTNEQTNKQTKNERTIKQ